MEDMMSSSNRESSDDDGENHDDDEDDGNRKKNGNNGSDNESLEDGDDVDEDAERAYIFSCDEDRYIFVEPNTCT